MLKEHVDEQEEFVRPATPEIKLEKKKDKGSSSDDKQPRLPGKKRHRRAKGKRKKQKTCLMITNDDGTHSTTSQEPAHQQRKVCLRPSNNPLLKAPKNSTQYIIDDHENSNLFVDFGDERSNEAADPDPEQYFGVNDSDRLSPDDDNFFTEYAERDFESVYATAHQEEVSSWEREKIIEEISAMEKRQKQLVEVLSTIDPTVYLQKLQHELLSLQEVNRQLKLRNIAERLERQQIRDRRGIASGHSSPRLPDSTSNVGEDGDESDGSSSGSSSSGSSSSGSSSSGTSSGSSSSSESDAESDGGGCSSGCCLADNCNDCEDDEKEDEEEGKKDEEEGKKDEKEKSDEVIQEAGEAVEDKGGEGTGDGIDQG